MVKQQSVADETQKLTVTVSRALHAMEATLALIPVAYSHVFTGRSLTFSLNYRWHDSIMAAVGALDDMLRKIPQVR